MMFGIAFHVNGTEWPCRAEVLAGTAPDAAFFVYNRNLGRFGVGRVGYDHEDGTSGAVAGTVAAFHAVGQGNAILLDPYGMTNLGDRLVGYGNRPYGAGGTDVSTFGTFRTAIAALV